MKYFDSTGNLKSNQFQLFDECGNYSEDLSEEIRNNHQKFSANSDIAAMLWIEACAEKTYGYYTTRTLFDRIFDEVYELKGCYGCE